MQIISDRVVVPRINKKLLIFYKQKTIQLNNGKHMNGHFFKDNIQMAKMHMKRCLTSLVRETKITKIYHFTPTRIKYS